MSERVAVLVGELGLADENFLEDVQGFQVPGKALGVAGGDAEVFRVSKPVGVLAGGYAFCSSSSASSGRLSDGRNRYSFASSCAWSGLKFFFSAS
jgi:hypothetical protein